MNNVLKNLAMLAIAGGVVITAQASTPEEDRAAFVKHYKFRFPEVPMVMMVPPSSRNSLS